MKRTRIVVVGFGRMGKAQHRVMRDTPGVDVVAVVDPVATKTAELGSTPLVASLADLPADGYDAAVVATPTAMHFDVARELVARDKHLLVEKPITSTFDQARTLLSEAQQRKLKLAVGHVERFNPAVRKLREIIRNGWLGTPIHFSFTRVGGYPDTVLRGNNVILDLAVHDIDVLRGLVGPVRLAHSMAHVTWKEDVVDTAEIFVAAQNGPSASIHVNWVTPTKIRSIRVTGTRGVCFVDYVLQTCELMGGHLLKSIEPGATSYETFQDMYRATDRIQFGVVKVEPLRAQAEQFHAYLVDGDPGELATGYDAAAAVLIAERALKPEALIKPRPSVAPDGGAPPSLAGVPSLSAEWV